MGTDCAMQTIRQPRTTTKAPTLWQGELQTCVRRQLGRVITVMVTARSQTDAEHQSHLGKVQEETNRHLETFGGK